MSKPNPKYDVIVLGAGAAGMMCAIEAGRRGRDVLLVDHANAPGEKIRISGGGRCNFTNTRTVPANFISQNPHFCKSALKRYTAKDFIAKVDAHAIAYHEKTLGQLFCDQSSKQIITMLSDECRDASVTLRLSSSVETIERTGDGYVLATTDGPVTCTSLVIATGGKSIPKMGATDFAYRTAKQFGLSQVETRPALVPLAFAPDLLEATKALTGVSTETTVACNGAEFREAMLFTHRGVSGPSILQISSYWREGDEVSINLAPDVNLMDALRNARQSKGKLAPNTVLSEHLPKRLADAIAKRAGADGRIGDYPDKRLQNLSNAGASNRSAARGIAPPR